MLPPPSEQLSRTEGAIAEVLRIQKEPTRILYHSAHSTFSRDQGLVSLAATTPTDVTAASPLAVEMALDKLRMKRLFASHHLPSPEFAAPGEPLPRKLKEQGCVVKVRGSTAGAGVTYHAPYALSHAPDGAVTEVFIEGEEFSVNVFSLGDRITVFPPVWKGRTTPELLHPVKRLRLCPAPAVLRSHHERMMRIACDLVSLLETEGFCEVEFVIGTGPLVLEINPRISGTLRLALLAAQVSSSLPLINARAGSTLLPAKQYAIEVPYCGKSFADGARGIFATTRLTASGGSYLAAFDKLSSFLEGDMRELVRSKLASISVAGEAL